MNYYIVMVHHQVAWQVASFNGKPLAGYDSVFLREEFEKQQKQNPEHYLRFCEVDIVNGED